MGAALDAFFYNFDVAIYKFVYQFDCEFLNAISNVLHSIGRSEGHIIIFLICLLFCFPKKTRKYGVALCAAWCFNMLTVHVIAKPMIGRMRPYTTLVDSPFWETFKAQWTYTGMHYEDDMSCPSGHTTLAFSVIGSLVFTLSKDKHYWAWALMLLPCLMAFSRIYICVHYPSDVLFGMIFGLIAAVFGYFCGEIYKKYLKGKRILKIEL